MSIELDNSPWDKKDTVIAVLIGMLIIVFFFLWDFSFDNEKLQAQVVALQSKSTTPSRPKPENTIYTIGDLHLGLPVIGSDIKIAAETQNKDMIDIDWAYTKLQWRVEQLEQQRSGSGGDRGRCK